MKRIHTLILVSILGVAYPIELFPQVNDIRTKNVEVKYADATLQCEVLITKVEPQIDNMKKYYWYDDALGQQNTTGGFSGFLLHGKRQIFSEKNKLISQANFYLGLKEGEEKLWDENGKLVSNYYHKKGVCYKGIIYHMETSNWDKNYYIVWEYDPPKMETLSESDRQKLLKRRSGGYDHEMQCLFCVSLPGCVKTVYSKFYNEPYSKLTILPDDKDILIVYYENSNQIHERISHDWLGIGKYEKYYKNGKLKTLGQMVGDEIKGEVKHFDENGNLLYTETIK